MYMNWVDEVVKELEWKSAVGPAEIVYQIAHLIETNHKLLKITEVSHEEVVKKSFETKWMLGTCKDGESCWCSSIRCDPPLMHKDPDSSEQQEYFPVKEGYMDKKTAEYFVRLHNNAVDFSKTFDKMRKHFEVRKDEH